jgi:acetyltransferase-like isoleucine patch superfamily enzyme
MRKFVLVLAVVLPNFVKVFLYRHIMRWKIGRHCRFGMSYIDAANVELGDDVHIGHFNIIRGLAHLSVGQATYIANFNELFGCGRHGDFTSELKIGSGCQIMSHHFFDVSGTIVIGNGTTIGGRDTHFWSHSLDGSGDRPELVKLDISLGDDVYVGARATLVGCKVPDSAVVAAGSVVVKSFEAETDRILLAGNPAVVKRRYPRKSRPDVLLDAAVEDGRFEKTKIAD